ncbi:MAG: hypothetical protein ACI4F4_02855 [Lachnospiraceae bacterium]
MTPSYIVSLFYGIAFIFCLTGLFRIKKSNQVLFGATWLPVSALLISFYQCLFAAIGTVLHIPVNLLSVGIADVLLGCVCWYFILKKGTTQKHCVEKIDVIAWVIMFGAIAMFAYHRYGLDMHLHYISIDPAQHLKMAMNTMYGQRVSAMYYACFHNGLLIQLLAPFRDPTRYYQIYVFGDVLHLLLACLMFYGTIRKYLKDNFLKIAAVIVSLIYVNGYPANSTIFGFTYLGMCVTIIACTIVLVDGFISDELNKWMGVVFISLCCLGIFEGYVLFMPVMFFSIFFCVLYKQHQMAKLVSWDTIKICLGIFLIPTIIGLYFTYNGVFASSGTTVGSAISQEGGIYKDLFSNFVLILPLALFGFYYLAKEKKKHVLLFIFPLLAGFILSLFALGMTERVSSYYFYKNYYLLWLIVFVLAFIGLTYVEKKSRLLIAMGLFMWLFVLYIGHVSIETRIGNRNARYVTNNNSHAFCDVFIFNRDAKGAMAYSGDKLKVYQYVMKELMGEDEAYIPLAGSWEDYYWMEAITNQRSYDFQYWNTGDESFFENLMDVNYVMAFRDSNIYQNYSQYFDNMEKVYENECGFVAIVENTMPDEIQLKSKARGSKSKKGRKKA